MSIKKLLILAFLIRLFLLPITYHPDVNNHFWWGIYAQDFGFRGYYDFVNFGNYGRPEYPPFSIFMFTFLKYLYDFIFSVFWQININVSFFPSQIISWLDINGYKTLLKFPSIIADIGIGLIIYKWISEKLNKKKAVFAMNLFLFNPAIIYVSALWGQIESIITFFAILSLYYLDKKQLHLSQLAYYLKAHTSP